MRALGVSVDSGGQGSRVGSKEALQHQRPYAAGRSLPQLTLASKHPGTDNGEEIVLVTAGNAGALLDARRKKQPFCPNNGSSSLKKRIHCDISIVIYVFLES